MKAVKGPRPDWAYNSYKKKDNLLVKDVYALAKGLKTNHYSDTNGFKFKTN